MQIRKIVEGTGNAMLILGLTGVIGAGGQLDTTGGFNGWFLAGCAAAAVAGIFIGHLARYY